MKDHAERLDIDKIVAIFDCDREGMNQIKSLQSQREEYELFNEGEGSLKHRHKDIFVMSLVPSDFRKKFVTMSANYEWCYLTTELLYQDNIIPTINRKRVAPDSTLFQFRGKKTNFLNKVKGVDGSVDFSGFKPTWDKIESIAKVLDQ